MNNPAVAEPSSARADRTRAAILAAAEDLFARRGFAAARLEDVADTVKMTRAALFYYYKDKQALYDAMFEDAFGPLRDELERILAADASISGRIEMAAGAWVDTLVARPTLARLLMRFVADGPEPHIHGIFSDDDQITMRFLALFEEGRSSGEITPVDDNFFLVASSVVGTTIFYVGALATLVPPNAQPSALETDQIVGLKAEVLRSMRHLLGIKGKTRRTATSEKSTRRKRE
ncbi:MAG: TetR/AcrR family transcriptional regulator [Pseudomonadota bacterium]|nr:TetR/AcrR family transcriptional regulator [Pseudomonadota bacterium]